MTRTPSTAVFVAKATGDATGDGAGGGAVADHATVDFDDRDEFAHRAVAEDLVGAVELGQ